MEGPDSPQPRDGGVNTGDECCPPLVVSRPAADHGRAGGEPGGDQEEAARHLYQGTQQEDAQSSQVQAGQVLAESLEPREIVGVSEVHCSADWAELVIWWAGISDLIWLLTSQLYAYILIWVILKNVRKLGNPDSGIMKSDKV